MKLVLPAGTTSAIIHVFVMDNTVGTGAGKIALTNASFSGYYIRAGGTLQVLTINAVATLGTFAQPTNVGCINIIKVHDTNVPGLYEIHLHDSQLVAGANQIVFYLTSAGTVPTLIEIQLLNTAASVTLATDQPVNVTKVNGTSQTAGDIVGLLSNGTYGLNSLHSDIAAIPTTAPDNTGITNIYNIVNSATFGNSALNAKLTDATFGLNALHTDIAAIPTASGTASAVRTELTVELARIDAAISSRSTLAAGAKMDLADTITTAGAESLITKMLAMAAAIDGKSLKATFAHIAASCVGINGTNATDFLGMDGATLRVEGTVSGGKRSAVTLHDPA